MWQCPGQLCPSPWPQVLQGSRRKALDPTVTSESWEVVRPMCTCQELLSSQSPPFTASQGRSLSAPPTQAGGRRRPPCLLTAPAPTMPEACTAASEAGPRHSVQLDTHRPWATWLWPRASCLRFYVWYPSQTPSSSHSYTYKPVPLPTPSIFSIRKHFSLTGFLT